MRGRHLISSFILLALASAPLSAAKEPLHLKPSSKWLVDYKEDSCRLVREFGEGDDKTIVLFNRYGPTQSFQLTIAGNPVDQRSGMRDAELQFGPAEKLQKAYFVIGKLGKLDSLVFIGDLLIAPRTEFKKNETPGEGEAVEPARLAAIRTLTVGRPLPRSVVIETGALEKPFAALEACARNLLTSWGLDVEKHNTLKQWVIPTEDPNKWMGSLDYPVKMLQAGQPSLVQYRLMVDSEGNVSSCHIQETTRPKEFDDAVCDKLTKRAKFTPAIDAEGKPMASYYRGSVSFQFLNP